MKTLDKEILKRVEEYNISYQREHGITPSYRQIMNTLHLSSLATVSLVSTIGTTTETVARILSILKNEPPNKGNRVKLKTRYNGIRRKIPFK